MPPVIDKTKCNGCGTCDRHCPVDVIHFDRKTKQPVVAYPEECWHCGSCRIDCPTQAVSIVFSPRFLLL